MPAILAAAIAALAGCATMGVELTGVRLLAPHFGDSAWVWTNVIGVILAALAAGAFLGGRLAARSDARRVLAVLFGCAAAMLVAAPLVARPLGGWLVPQELPLDAALPALVRGSLAATVLLFAPPVWLLGAASPILVTLVVRGGGVVGGAVGAVSAAGTIGSLFGTFATTHLLVPAVGCRLTIWICAGLLAACAVATVRPRRGAAAAITVLALAAGLASDLGSLAAAANAMLGPLRPPRPDTELLAEVESRQQFLQIVRDPMAAGGALTALRINEGLDSFHSVAIDGSVLTGGRYYDWHAVVPLLAGDGRRPDGLRALSIGDAGGSFRRIYDGVHPGAVVDAVELDAATIALGDRFFAGRKAPGRVFVLDGRVFVDRSTERWHVVHVDAYAHQVYVPAHLASREFFAALRERLLPGGVVACNVGGLRIDDPVLVAVASSMRTAFPEVAALQVPDSRNFVLLGRDRPLLASTLAAWSPGPERLGAADLRRWRDIVAATAVPGALQPVPPGAPLDDDRPALDRLLHESYVAVGDPRTAVPIAGSVALAAAEGLAFAAAQRRDHAGVLAAVGSSREPSAYLRLLAGDTRWQLRHLRAAAAEYEAATGLPSTDDLRATLARRRADLDQELAPYELAAQVGGRNAWLALFGVALLGCGAWAAWRAAVKTAGA